MTVTRAHSKRDFLALRLHSTLFKALGLAPFTLNIASKTHKNITQVTLDYRYSTVGSIYNVMLNLILSLMICFVASTIVDEFNSNVVALKYCCDLILVITGNVSCTLVLLIFSFRQKTLVMLVNRYLRWEISLIEMAPNSYSSKKHVFHILLVMMYAVINVVACTANVLWVIDSNMLKLLNVMSGVILGFLMVQYSIVLSAIQTGFYRLNKLLELMAMPRNVHHLDVISIDTNSMRDSLSLENFFIIKRAYRALAEILFDFSMFYTWPIICAISYIYVESIYCAYHFIMSFVASSFNPLVSLTIWFWVMRDVFGLVELAGCAIKTSTELDRTRGIVYKIIDNCTTHTPLKYELELFANELLDRNISYIAHGLISLDGSFLKSMLGTMITYLIILVQFDKQIRGAESITETNK